MTSRMAVFKSLMLVGGILFIAAPAHAVPITVESQWLRTTNLLTTTAVFESGGVTDFSGLQFSLSSFDLLFTPPLGSISVTSAVLTPTDQIFIRFSAAGVIDYSGGAEYSPSPGIVGSHTITINPSIDRLVVNLGFSGQSNHLLQSSSIVPEPTTGALLLSGLMALTVARPGDRKRRQIHSS